MFSVCFNFCLVFNMNIIRSCFSKVSWIIFDAFIIVYFMFMIFKDILCNKLRRYFIIFGNVV